MCTGIDPGLFPEEIDALRIVHFMKEHFLFFGSSSPFNQELRQAVSKLAREGRGPVEPVIVKQKLDPATGEIVQELVWPVRKNKK